MYELNIYKFISLLVKNRDLKVKSEKGKKSAKCSSLFLETKLIIHEN